MKSNDTSRYAIKYFLSFLFIFAGISCGHGDLDFDILFQDGDGLKPGQPVIFKGVEIGEVTRVGIDEDGTVRFSVTIKDEYRDTVYREARYTIEKPDGSFSYSDLRQITIYDRSSESRTTVTPGDVIEGSDGLLADWMEAAAGYGKQLWAAAEVAFEEFSREIAEFSHSPEGQDLQRELRNFGEKIRQLNREQVEAFRREHLPVIEQNVRDMRDRLEAAGKSKEAEDLWKAFQSWYEAVLDEH
jgi:hypothetical protein